MSGRCWHVALVAPLVLLVSGCGDGYGTETPGADNGPSDGPATEIFAAAAADEPAVGVIGGLFPKYWAPTLDGDPVALSSLAGEVVLLNVWATWCPPCRREMPSLQALHEQFADQGLRVVGVSIDAAAREPELRAFLEEVGVTYTILHDPDERISRVMPIVGIPHTFLIGRDRTFLRQWFGEIDATGPEITAAVREALAAPDPEQR